MFITYYTFHKCEISINYIILKGNKFKQKRLIFVLLTFSFLKLFEILNTMYINIFLIITYNLLFTYPIHALKFKIIYYEYDKIFILYKMSTSSTFFKYFYVNNIFFYMCAKIIIGDSMDFKDILAIDSKPSDVYLGYKDEELLKLDLKEHSSVIITGSTGTSKSVMINQILLQLVNKNNSNDLKIVSINPTKVELKPYRVTKYSYNKQIDLECHDFNELLKIMKKRMDLFKEYNVKNYYEYNKLNYKSNLPLIVLAIDEATFLLEEKNSDEKLRWIITNCKETGVILLLTTNNIYNNFFSKGYNTLASIRISFDFVSNEDAKLTNLHGCDKLAMNEFLIEIDNTSLERKYNTFTYDDNTIKEILK